MSRNLKWKREEKKTERKTKYGAVFLLSVVYVSVSLLLLFISFPFPSPPYGSVFFRHRVFVIIFRIFLDSPICLRSDRTNSCCLLRVPVTNEAIVGSHHSIVLLRVCPTHTSFVGVLLIHARSYIPQSSCFDYASGRFRSCWDSSCSGLARVPP